MKDRFEQNPSELEFQADVKFKDAVWHMIKYRDKTSSGYQRLASLQALRRIDEESDSASSSQLREELEQFFTYDMHLKDVAALIILNRFPQP